MRALVSYGVLVFETECNVALCCIKVIILPKYSCSGSSEVVTMLSRQKHLSAYLRVVNRYRCGLFYIALQLWCSAFLFWPIANYEIFPIITEVPDVSAFCIGNCANSLSGDLFYGWHAVWKLLLRGATVKTVHVVFNKVENISFKKMK